MNTILNLTSDTENMLTNTSRQPQPHRVIKSEDIAVIVVYGTIALTSLLGNSITIAVILRNPVFHTLYNFLLLNLAAADFLTGFVSLLQLVVAALDSQTDVLCKIFTGVIYFNIAVSINTLTVIAFERYYGIVQPLVHRNRSSKRLKFIIPFVWLSAIVIATPIATEIRLDRETRLYCFVSAEEKDWATWKLVLGYLGVITVFVIPLVAITILYSKIVIHFKTTNQAQAAVVGENTNGAEIAHKRAVKTVRMLIIVTILFSVALLPELVFFFLILYDRKYVNARLFYKVGIPTVASIAVNPFVYTLSNSTFLQEAKRLFSCVRLRGNPVNIMTTSTRGNAESHENNKTLQSVT